MDVQTQLGKCWRAVRSRGSQTSCRFTPASLHSAGTQMGQFPEMNQLQNHTWGSSGRGLIHPKRESTRNKHLCNPDEQVMGPGSDRRELHYLSMDIPVDFCRCSSRAVTSVHSTWFPLWHAQSWISQNRFTNTSLLSKESPNWETSDSKVRGLSSTLSCLQFGLPAQHCATVPPTTQDPQTGLSLGDKHQSPFFFKNHARGQCPL